MDSLRQDIRYGLRMLFKNRGFATVALLTLALGIGGNTAIFSVVNTVLLRPLPYSAPERLVFVYNSIPGLYPKMGLMEAEFLRLRDQARSLERVSLYTSATFTLTGMGEAARVSSGTASGAFFEALGVPLALGRSFDLEEEPQGQGNVVILGHDFWRREFSANPSAIGQSLTLDGRSYTIIGVLPQGFRSPLELQFEQAIELWVPPSYDPASPCCSHGLNVVARLREGQPLEQAQAEIRAIIAGVMKEYPQGYPKDGSKQILVRPLQHEIVGDLSRALWILLAAVGFVLLIACANVANLLLARGEGRQKEIAIRAALGAGHVRIIRQLLVESLLLAVVGGGLGLLIAWLSLRLLPILGLEKISRLQEVALDARVLCFTLVISLLTGLAFGLAPAIHAVKFDLQAALKEGGRTSASSGSRSGLRNALVVPEVALSLVLLTGAGLLIRSFWRLRQVETGFATEHLLSARLFPPASTYQDDRRVATFYENLVQHVRALPGVKDAAVASGAPLGSRNAGTVMQTEAGQRLEWSSNTSAQFRVVSPGYFRTLDVRLVRGRLIEDSDHESATPVAVVNETLARTQWPDENPLDKRLRLLDAPPERAKTVFLTVVGVVADAKNSGLIEAAQQEVFVPLRQRAVAVAGMGFASQMTLVAHTSVEPLSLADSIRQEVWALDRNIPVTDVRTMEQILATFTAQPRFNTILLGVFGAVALILAAVGIYGVLSYSVTQRTHEIGIRIALGARPHDVFKSIVGKTLMLVLIGVGVGLASAVALTRVMESLLFEVSATDPLTFAVISAVLTGVALAACFVPARRATKVDPMVALRYE
jgi:putative ABC transport system permease protein